MPQVLFHKLFPTFPPGEQDTFLVPRSVCSIIDNPGTVVESSCATAVGVLQHSMAVLCPDEVLSVECGTGLDHYSLTVRMA